MIDLSRVAFVACGCLREFSRCYTTWNIFKEQHNYVFTWDTDYKKTKPDDSRLYPMKVKENDLITAKNDKFIVDYEIYLERGFEDYSHKSPFLWSQLEDYISYDYDYVFITRPDIILTDINSNFIKHNYSPPGQNEIQTIRVDDDEKKVSDCIFFMRRDTYKEFSNVYEYLTTNSIMGDIHQRLYQFFKEKNMIATDVLRYCISNHNINRPTSKISKLVIDTHQINEELIRSMEMSYLKLRDNSFFIIVLELESHIDPIKKNFIFKKAMDSVLHKIPIKNPTIRFFQTSNVDNVGIEKVRNYIKNYNLNVSDIFVVRHSDLF